jgi:uncharacterized protein (TIGR02145 family)
MNNVKWLLGILSVACVGTAQVVDLSGTVTDSLDWNSLQNVVVALKHSGGLSSITDTAGKYHLSQTSIINQTMKQYLVPGSRLNGNNLVLNIPENASVAVEIFSTSGAKVRSIFKGSHVSAGTYSLNLLREDLARGEYIVRSQYGEKISINKFTRMFDNRYYSSNSTRPEKSSGLTKLLAASVDTLVFSRAGFDTLQVPITGYTGVHNARLQTNTVTDIDGNVYHMETIGTQVWTVENLKTTKCNDGRPIASVTDGNEWANLGTPGYCWYEDSIAYGPTYGALYNWFAVNTGKLAPTGWHVPTDSEWTILATYCGGLAVAGGKLKEILTTHWLTPNTGASNDFGFTALPGGQRGGSGGFGQNGTFGKWWSATASPSTNWSDYFYINSNETNLVPNSDPNTTGYSVRCVKDN